MSKLILKYPFMLLFNDPKNLKKIEAECKEKGLQTILIPVPPDIVTDCGFALGCTSVAQRDIAIELVKNSKFDVELYIYEDSHIKKED